MESLLSLTTSADSGADPKSAAIGDHPGDMAPPRDTLDWIETIEESIGGGAYGTVLNNAVPPQLKRSTEPHSLDTIPELVGDTFTAQQKATRVSDRAKMTEENARKLVERNDSMADYYNRVATVLRRTMKKTAFNQLKRLLAANICPTNAKMHNGVDMIDQMRTEAEARLGNGEVETQKRAKEAYKAWIIAASTAWTRTCGR